MFCFKKDEKNEIRENQGKSLIIDEEFDNSFSQINSESEELDYKDLKKNEKLKHLINKGKFFHSHDLSKIEIDSYFEESEIDIDESPIRELEEQAINDYEDVEKTDKKFFCLWNKFVREAEKKRKKENNIKFKNGSDLLETLCYKNYHEFVEKFVIEKKEILKEELRYNFILHLRTLLTNNYINIQNFTHFLNLINC